MQSSCLSPIFDQFPKRKKNVSALYILRRLTNFLRTIPGGVLIGELVRTSMGTNRKTVRVDDFDGDLIMYLDLSEHMQGQIFWHGSYSIEIIALLKRVLPRGGTVIDCGANVGEISLLAAKLVGPAGQVYSFEPIGPIADQLDRHGQENNFGNIEILRVGVARESGASPIYMAAERFVDGSHHDGLGTMFPTETRSALVGEIPLVSIDDFARSRNLQRLDLIKIDIEGGELSALQGAKHVLATLKPALIVEVSAQTCEAAGYKMQDVYRFLEENGYTIYCIRRKGALKPIDVDDLSDFQNLYCIARA